MIEPMLLTMSGILATLMGVGVGCLVLELTVRALTHKLTEQPAKPNDGRRLTPVQIGTVLMRDISS